MSVNVGFIKYIKPPMIKTCDQCGDFFDTYIHNALRCSKKCKDTYRAKFERGRRSKLPKNNRYLKCSVCDNIVRLQLNSKVTNICCSDECKKTSASIIRKRFLKSEKGKSLYKKHANSDKRKSWYEKYKKTEKYKKSRKRIESTVIYRLTSVMRATINRCCKKEGTKSRYLDYTSQQLKSHLESLFKDGICWDNYGKWHIDHIKPLAKFNFFDNNGNVKLEIVREANSLENLQPLWASENLRKGGK